MANETDTGLIALDPAAEALAALAAQPFDPATLLKAPRPRPSIVPEGAEALPYAAGPKAEVVGPFDPATLLGDAAKRGPATIGDGKPLVARIGGVEVVTIPLEHYAALLSPLAFARPGIVDGEAKPNADGMLMLLLSLLHDKLLPVEAVALATGLDVADLLARSTAAHGLSADGFGILPAHEAAEVPSTAVDNAAAYEAAAQSGEVRGGPMDRAGEPAEPLDKVEAAYHEAGRGKKRR